MFWQWFCNLKWIRAIREYDNLRRQIKTLETDAQLLKQTCLEAGITASNLRSEVAELELALEAKASTHSAMAKVLRGIDERVNSTGYRRSAPTLRRRNGESMTDLMVRYDIGGKVGPWRTKATDEGLSPWDLDQVFDYIMRLEGYIQRNA